MAGTFFVSTNILEFRNLLQSERSATLLIETLYQYRAQGKYLLHAFVVMPNHIHLILTPNDNTVEWAMKLIKGGFSFRARERFGWQGSIWLRSFRDRRLRDAEEFATRKAYLEENPVRAHLCARPEHWPFSSANGRFELDPIPQQFLPRG